MRTWSWYWSCRKCSEEQRRCCQRWQQLICRHVLRLCNGSNYNPSGVVYTTTEMSTILWGVGRIYQQDGCLNCFWLWCEGRLAAVWRLIRILPSRRECNQSQPLQTNVSPPGTSVVHCSHLGSSRYCFARTVNVVRIARNHSTARTRYRDKSCELVSMISR